MNQLDVNQALSGHDDSGRSVKCLINFLINFLFNKLNKLSKKSKSERASVEKFQREREKFKKKQFIKYLIILSN